MRINNDGEAYLAEAVTVPFDTKCGSVVDPRTLAKGEKAEKPADPVNEGLPFEGWQLNGKDYDFDVAVSENITLTAKWGKSGYPLWVGSTQVTDSNKADFLGDGTASYAGDQQGGTLTLNDPKITDGYKYSDMVAGIYSELGSLKITGSADLMTQGFTDGINARGNVDLNGTFKIKVRKDF